MEGGASEQAREQARRVAGEMWGDGAKGEVGNGGVAEADIGERATVGPRLRCHTASRRRTAPVSRRRR